VTPPARPVHPGGDRVTFGGPIDGTGFGVVYLGVPPVISGLAVGSLVVGVSSILVSLLVACFGLAGASGGWGGWVAGAFAVLGVLCGGAGIWLGVLGRRQVRRVLPPPAVRFTGQGLALGGLICGGVGLGITLLSLAGALLLQL
jgi:hypothetical protein